MRIFLVSWRLALCGFCAAASAAGAGQPLKVCMLSGCDTYHSEKSLPPFQEYLEQNYNVRSTFWTAGRDVDKKKP
jgi:hypothetical protein